jgi:hypothetical protein
MKSGGKRPTLRLHERTGHHPVKCGEFLIEQNSVAAQDED